ncbi:MAG: 50S ribosomal protein L32 [Erysipelotrichaceae bacterium]|jgi:large subunit ribosomal protein L32
MAVQQRRVSKTRKNKRRTHYKLVAPTLVKCKNCGEYRRPHYQCECGEK